MKKSVRNKACIFILMILSGINASAVRIGGVITDEHNNPLPFVTVFVQGTTTGTTSNEEGVYSIELLEGTYEITFRLISYRQETKRVTVTSEPVTLDIRLLPELYNLKEVTVRADAEDPAYQMIRNAQKMRKTYRDQVERYSCDSYVKSTQMLTDYPKKLFGQEIKIEEILDTTSKIFYLSESVSRLHYSSPDYSEEMVSSRVSGQPRTYSFNKSSDVLISFYESSIKLGGLTPRGIISPIAPGSLFYYDFRFEGSFIENDELINRISVKPKRTNDPVFTGMIFIVDGSWRIHSANLFITRNQQMEFVDTFRIVQNFIPQTKDIWMPFSHQFSYSFSFLGFKGSGTVLGIFSNYNLQPDFGGVNFRGEVMKINEEANKKDSSYWTGVRPVPLTDFEVFNYNYKDSVRSVHESQPYLDSVDRAENKFSFNDILTGYTWQNSSSHKNLTIHSPAQQLYFNTVEGWNATMTADYEKHFGEGDNRHYEITPMVRYGFSNRRLNGNVKFNYRYDTKNLSDFSFAGGTNVLQINNHEPVSPIINTAYSILAEKNYMKLYEKRFISAGHRTELFNGFVLGLNAEYARRISLSNSSDYKLVSVEDRRYTSNDPFNPHTDSLKFPHHNALMAEVSVRIRFAQEYLTRPEGKYIIGSDWPEIGGKYRKGIRTGSGSINYEYIEVSVNDEMEMGLLGRMNYVVSYGEFLSRKSLYLPDLRHFNGNKTFISDFDLNGFKNLEYYEYSTSGPFVELHVEQNFGGFLLNKIPLIRKLKLREIAAFRFMHSRLIDSYAEASLGIEKLGIFRADVFTSFREGRRGSVGFVLGIKRIIGN